MMLHLFYEYKYHPVVHECRKNSRCTKRRFISDSSDPDPILDADHKSDLDSN